jgi:hypothetical protein
MNVYIKYSARFLSFVNILTGSPPWPNSGSFFGASRSASGQGPNTFQVLFKNSSISNTLARFPAR